MKRKIPVFCAVVMIPLCLIGFKIHFALAAASAKVTFASGSVSVQAKGKTAWAPAKAGTALGAGDKVKTGKSSKVEIKFSDGSVIRLASMASLTIVKMESGNKNKTNVKTEKGNVWAKVKTVAGKTEFETQSPTLIAGVRGTVYRMNIKEDDTTVVKVYKGKVEVKTWLEAIKKQQEMMEKGLKPEKSNEEPYEVEGPTEVTMEQWYRIVGEMQQITIGKKGFEDVKPFNAEEDAKDPWVQWNKERDKLLEKEWGG